jgi:hypothetical protein
MSFPSSEIFTYWKHCFEHGLLHVHVRSIHTCRTHLHIRSIVLNMDSCMYMYVLRHARLLLSFLVPQFTRVCIGVVLEGMCTYMLAHCSACMQKFFSPVAYANEPDTSIACIACGVKPCMYVGRSNIWWNIFETCSDVVEIYLEFETYEI